MEVKIGTRRSPPSPVFVESIPLSDEAPSALGVRHYTLCQLPHYVQIGVSAMVGSWAIMCACADAFCLSHLTSCHVGGTQVVSISSHLSGLAFR